MRYRGFVSAVIALAAAVAGTGCRDQTPGERDTRGPTAGNRDKESRAVELVDLSTSLAAVREAFNARKGEARFLTLLSPT